MGSSRLIATLSLLSRPACGALLLSVGVTAAGTGCATPSAANITLRKQNAELLAQIDDLHRLRDADQAQIRGLQEQIGTVPTLPHDRLKDLVTVGSIQVTRLTSGFDETRKGGPDTGVRAHVRLHDTAGDVIKAAGTFTVEVFDLAEPSQPLVAKRSFPADQADEFWVPTALVYAFVLPVPWTDNRPPKHDELTVKVTYLDALTQRSFTEQAVIKVKLPPPDAASRPTTAASGT